MKQQITENEENLFFGKKIAQVSVITLKVSHSLTSGGTFVVYIVHPMCSDVYIISKIVFCLFDLILNVPSTIFQLYRDGSSWVEPVLS